MGEAAEKSRPRRLGCRLAYVAAICGAALTGNVLAAAKGGHDGAHETDLSRHAKESTGVAATINEWLGAAETKPLLERVKRDPMTFDHFEALDSFSEIVDSVETLAQKADLIVDTLLTDIEFSPGGSTLEPHVLKVRQLAVAVVRHERIVPDLE